MCAGEYLLKMSIKRLNSAGVNALGALYYGLGVTALLALLIGHPGHRGKKEHHQLVGHMHGFNVVQTDQRILGAVGIVGGDGALLLLVLSVNECGQELACRCLAGLASALKASHRLGSGEVNQEKAHRPRRQKRSQARFASQVIRDKVSEQSVCLGDVDIRNIVQGLHLWRTDQQDIVLVSAILHDAHPIGRNDSYLITRIVKTEVDGILRKVAVHPGVGVTRRAIPNREVGEQPKQYQHCLRRSMCIERCDWLE